MVSTIKVFEGSHAFLSNFFIEPDGTTVEHDFQAAKTFDLAWQVKILECDTPGKAKRMGRKCPIRADWDDVRVEVMREKVLRKFWDHPNFARLLLATGDAVLIEGNHWHDNFWGDCWCSSCENKPGKNNLGIVLTEVRDLIDSLN